MRVRGKPWRATQFVPEIFQMLFGEAAFEKGAGVDARRRVALKVNEIAGLVAIAAAEEMVEPNLKQGSQGCIGGDMPADTIVVLILMGHHGHGIPAHQTLDPALGWPVSRIGHFLIRRDRIDVVRVDANRDVNAVFAGTFGELVEDEIDPVGPSFIDDLIEGFQPFGGLTRVEIRSAFSAL